MIDQNFSVAKAGPTAAGTEYSAALDCRAPSGIGNLTGRVRFKLEVPTITGLANTKTAIFTLQDSADNSTFADVAALPSVTVTGDGTSGPAVDNYWDWRKDFRRYLRVKVVLAASPGTITAYTYYLKGVLGDQPGT